MGRPSKYTKALAKRILDRMAAGETVRAICAGDDMPHEATVRRWSVHNENFRAAYAQAREEQADAMADEAIERSRNSTRETAAADRLAADTLKWAASKMKPHAYSDKLQLEHQGEQTVKVVVEYVEDDDDPVADDPPPAQ